MKCQMTFAAHDCDVNVISWNTHTKFLLASGDDKGEFRIWDLRMLGGAKGSSTKKELDSITRIRWHTQAITSIAFEPREEAFFSRRCLGHSLRFGGGRGLGLNDRCGCIGQHAFDDGRLLVGRLL